MMNPTASLLLFSSISLFTIGWALDDALVTEQVFLDLEVEGGEPESVIIGLFGGTAPKTVKNFVALANHEVRHILCSA